MRIYLDHTSFKKKYYLKQCFKKFNHVNLAFSKVFTSTNVIHGPGLKSPYSCDPNCIPKGRMTSHFPHIHWFTPNFRLDSIRSSAQTYLFHSEPPAATKQNWRGEVSSLFYLFRSFLICETLAGLANSSQLYGTVLLYSSKIHSNHFKLNCCLLE